MRVAVVARRTSTEESPARIASARPRRSDPRGAAVVSCRQGGRKITKKKEGKGKFKIILTRSRPIDSGCAASCVEINGDERRATRIDIRAQKEGPRPRRATFADYG